MERRIQQINADKKLSHETRVKKVAAAIRRDKAQFLKRCYFYPYWVIDVCATERKKCYADLTVSTDLISTDGKTQVTYLKIEIDEYSDFKRLIRKMMRMTGTGIVLSATTYRINKLLKAYIALLGKEKMVADGIFFGLINDFIRGGLLATTFWTLDGTTLHFQPKPETA